MAVKKIKSLKGEIDCPYCFSLLQWDNVKDIKVSNGNQYITCPECGQNVLLDKEKDYWVESDDSTPEGGGELVLDAYPYEDVDGGYYAQDMDYTKEEYASLFNSTTKIRFVFVSESESTDFPAGETAYPIYNAKNDQYLIYYNGKIVYLQFHS